MRNCPCRAPIARNNSKKVETYRQSVGVDARIDPRADASIRPYSRTANTNLFSVKN